MDRQALESLREGGASCPSELDLDRLSADELSSSQASEVAAHVNSCALCSERMATRRAGFAAFPELAPAPLLAAIRRRASEQQRAQGQWRRRLLIGAAPLLAAAAALAVVLLGHGPRDGAEPGRRGDDGVRQKGGLGLRVYRSTAAGSQRLDSGERVKSGERLRFVIDLPTASQVGILGIEASGALYVAWPTQQGEPTLRPSGAGQELPGAVALDDAKGAETLYLVACPEGSTAPALRCSSSGSASAPACPPECRLLPFVLKKE